MLPIRGATVYCGDCLHVLKEFPSESVDLIYADPPFFSERGFWRYQSEKSAAIGFDDKWSKGMSDYIKWMTTRLVECQRILRISGGMYLHCDSHASHYLKVALDSVFGRSNFHNEIVWKRQSAHNDFSQGARHFGRVHDVILFYSKSRNYKWNPQFRPYGEDYINKHYRYRDSAGRRYALGDLTGPGGRSNGNPKFELLGVKRHWRFSRRNMEELYRRGRIHQAKPGSVPKLVRYLDEMNGVPCQDVWIDIKPLTSQNRERTGYPTQKPLALLARIISASTDRGDIVLDPFCGCGTTLAAAQALERVWNGIDISRAACKIVKQRMLAEGVSCKIYNMRHYRERRRKRVLSSHSSTSMLVVKPLFTTS